MSFRYDFIGVGGLSYDLVLRVQTFPIADEKYPARLIGKLPGGFIANATCAAARLGLRTGYIGWMGDDADADMLHEDFVSWGVDPAGLVRVPEHPTPFTVVMSDTQGHRAILLPASPLYEEALTAAQLELAGQARAILTFPRDLEWFGHLRRRSLEAGGLLALDIENAVPMKGNELAQAIRMTDIVFLKHSSLLEIGVFSLANLATQPGQWLVMTAGKQGVQGIVHGMDAPLHKKALEVPVVDTTGAGDAFHAALIAARLEGATLDEALSFANAAAALKVQHLGARGGLPTRDQIAALL
jgi:sugar/nucleoside kinase (ribokinase family)